MIVRFHAIAAGGDAVGRDESGRAVFAPLAAPGDVARVEVLETRRSFARGRVLEVLETSPDRVSAPCPVFGACGGCQVQHLSSDAQLHAKTEIVRDALTRLGGFENPPVEPCRASPQPFAYRNKAELHAQNSGHADGVAGAAGGALGFYARESHTVVDVSHCPIQRAENNALLAFLRTERETLPRNIQGATLRAASNGESLLQLHPKTYAAWPDARAFAERAMQRVPGLVGVAQRVPNERGRDILRAETPPFLLAGRDWLEETVLDLKLRVSKFGFFQVNTGLTPQLADVVRHFAGAPFGQGRALDLYCGVGLFGLLLARDGWQTHGVEFSRSAIEDAKGNAQRNDLPARFTTGDAARELTRCVEKRETFDLVVLDPPRAGAKECVAPLLKLCPARIIYVSCDPATLSRDLKMLSASYELRRATPLDMFPQTGHVETVAWLQRRD